MRGETPVRHQPISMKRFVLTAAAFEGGLALLACALGWIFGTPPLRTLRFDLMGIIWGIAATLPPLVLFWLCLKIPLQPLREIVRILDQSVVPLFRNCRLAELAIIAALAGIGEETLFRGVVQTGAAQAIGGPHGWLIGLLAAGCLFGLVHSITPTYALLAAMIGIYLGAVWLACDNLLGPIIAHGLYDFLVLLYLLTHPSRSQ
jgi:uncharacterized protein